MMTGMITALIKNARTPVAPNDNAICIYGEEYVGSVMVSTCAGSSGVCSAVMNGS
jgi:hypothetical protein